MGRLVAVEEMVLADRVFRIGVLGQPYVGKTEIASQLARRLKHRLYGTAALSRALALIERDAPGARARELVEKLFERGFVLEPQPDPPFYRALLDIRDITDELREGGPLHVRGAQLLDDEAVRGALRDELLRRSAREGVVVEGAYAASLLSGRAHLFHLTADPGVRRARLFSHRPDVGSEEEAAGLLARLDAAAPPVGSDVVVVDVGSRTAAAATLEILWHLLPPGRRPHEDLSGRAPL
jgi:cytidylate kinase